MVTTITLVWSVTNITLSWGGVITQCKLPAESVLQCERQFARNDKISEFHIFAPPNAAPAQCRPGRMPPSRRHWCISSRMSTHGAQGAYVCVQIPQGKRHFLGGGAVSGQVQSRPIGISSASQKYSVGGSSDSACASTVQQLSVRCNMAYLRYIATFTVYMIA